MVKLGMKMAAVAVVATCLAGPVLAGNCAPRETVVEQLAADYGESRRSIGLAARGSVIEIFASQETGTWTITVTDTRGIACLVAAGQAFEAVDEALPASGDDA